MSEFVYHGTDVTDAHQIFDEGIQPLSQTDHESNWSQQDVPSIESHVYLTKYYPHYYGICAGETTSFAIYEVDLDHFEHLQLYPDEDFVVQAADKELIDFSFDSDSTMTEKTAAVRNAIETVQYLWSDSLNLLGNLSKHGQIPPSAIRRATVVTDPPSSFTLSIDPTITIENAQLCGEMYESYTKACFSEQGDIPHESQHQSLRLNQRDLFDDLSPTVVENPHYLDLTQENELR